MDDDDLSVYIDLLSRFDRFAETPSTEKMTLYIESELRNELEDHYRELVKECLEREEEPPLRNLDFYPAVIRAGLNGTSIEEELEIHDVSTGPTAEK